MNIKDKSFNFLGPLIDTYISQYKANNLLLELLKETRKLTDFFSLQICPGSSTSKLHHFYAGGLQQHIYEVINYGLPVIIPSNLRWFQSDKINENLLMNKSLFLIAAVWHDVGKPHDYERIYSFTTNENESNTWETTELVSVGLCLDERSVYEKCHRAGMVVKSSPHKKMVSHLSRSYYEFTKTAVDIIGNEAMKNPQVQLIQNAILAHHGWNEFGSPIEMKNWLSILLHQADYFSAHCSEQASYLHNTAFIPFNISLKDDEAYEKAKKNKS